RTSAIASPASRARANSRRAYSARTSPAWLRRTRRPMRSNRWTPRARSNSCTCLDTAGWLMSRRSAPSVMLPAWATAWKTARWFRFMLIPSSYPFDEKDVLDLSMPATVRFRTEDGQTGDRQQGRPASPPGFRETGGITMFARRRFLQGAAGAGLGSLLWANHHSFAKRGTPVSHPSEAVIFETVRTDGLAHLSYLVGDRAS